MYLKHFGFRRRPFDPVPDHRELFQTRGHQEVRARLRIALEERHPSLVLGDPGVGKTTSLRCALAEVDRNTYRLIEIHDPRLELRSFYRILATGLGLAPRFFFGDLSHQVREGLEKAEKDGRHPLLVVDDAQMLTEHALDSLRLLSNPSLDQNKPGISLLLVGDTTLGRRLKQPNFEAFVQRLRMTYRMQPIENDEGRRYIAHRIRTAGGDPDVFDADAIDSVLEEARGRLRTIDDLCTQALYAAFIAQDQVITQAHVQAVVAERKILRD